MSLIELPHTAGCLVCGRQNPAGLQMSNFVDASTGIVSATFTPRAEHIGFEGIIHGGILATVLDEAMVWAATWAGRRFCVCGELFVRFPRSVAVGEVVKVEARVLSRRARLIQTSGSILTQSGIQCTTATAKYVPVSPDRNAQFLQTLISEPSVERAMKHLLDAEAQRLENPLGS